MSEPVQPLEAVADALLAEAIQSAAARPLPGATYRLQFHAGFTFADATRLVPYLHDLGITHCYASPYLMARPGSMHGYDITDHRLLNPEIGDEATYAAWVDALSSAGMGQILDIVPNHMAITGNDNRWWNDVLENGPASPYAAFFDIDWAASTRPDLQGRVMVPILGEPYGKVLEAQQLHLSYGAGEFSIHYFDHRFPVAPQSYGLILGQRVEELKIALGAESPAALEYQSILTAVKNLPMRTETDPTRIAELQREKEVVKRRLATLAGEDDHVAASIEQTVELFNGKPGEPRSFDLMDRFLDEQAYRLAYWRVAADEINYRRFFDVNRLAALSMERPEVFAATHELILKLLREGKVAGLRIDHPDGLYNPGQYLRRLQEEYVWACARAAFDAKPQAAGLDWESLEPVLRPRIADLLMQQKCPLYVVVEKILIGDETLPEEWPIHGTSGYEFLSALNGVFVDDSAAAAFTRLYQDWIHDDTPWAELAYHKQILILQIALSSELQMLSNQLDRLAQRHRWSRDFTRLSLRRALREVIACFPVYRSYVTGLEIRDADRRAILRAVRRAMTKNPALSAALINFIRDTLLLKPAHGGPLDLDYQAEQLRFVGKFQQVTAPVMAKGIEDTAFYIFNRLVSLNEVGGDPDRFGTAPPALHEFFQQRQAQWPRALSATSTHDTKRSEDVRARLNVLSELPDEWARRLARWSHLNQPLRVILEDGEAPDLNEEYLLYQTLLGGWPLEPCGPEDHARFVERIQNYMTKALHEAKVHTSWINPNTAYDDAVREFIARIVSPQSGELFLEEFLPFQKRIRDFGMFNSLAQTLLKLTAPGVPDVYQGTELWDYSLVDPDNRRPVDYARRQQLLTDLKHRFEADKRDLKRLARELIATKEDGRIKLYLTWRALNLRREHPDVFAAGEYIPAETSGPGAEHVFGFVRRHETAEILAAVPRLLARLHNGVSPQPWSSAMWKDAALHLPESATGRSWRNVFTGETIVPRLLGGKRAFSISEMFAHFPVGLFISVR